MKYRLFLISAVAMLTLAACQKEKMEVYPKCFSISETTQVIFAPGNLQYNGALKKFSFAASQSDKIGSANNQISPTYGGTIDLFGWGTGDNPMKNSTVGTDYATFVDWGSKMDEAGWRTLSFEEWNYLLQKRPNANKLYGTCTIVTSGGTYQQGMIILPDKWDFSVDSVVVEFLNDNYNKHTYFYNDWKKMEERGAVFLPTAGNRMGTTVNGVSAYGRYWTSTPAPMGGAFFFGFCRAEEDDNNLRSNGRAVRLVKEITSPSQVPTK